jgi:phosphoribosyl-ATP pyrophosphohydrolase/phosphoribosyl-AMP cyclohydrolase
VVFFSRTRQCRWKKGESSGHRLQVKSVRTDCDRDVVLVHAEPLGPVCHLGTETCFDGTSAVLVQTTASAPNASGGVLEDLVDLVHSRIGESPEKSYTARLLQAGPPRIGQKVGEEGVELAIAAQSDDRQAIANEAADLLYHLAVLLESKGVSVSDISSVLSSRRGKSGLRPAN